MATAPTPARSRLSSPPAPGQGLSPTSAHAGRATSTRPCARRIAPSPRCAPASEHVFGVVMAVGFCKVLLRAWPRTPRARLWRCSGQHLPREEHMDRCVHSARQTAAMARQAEKASANCNRVKPHQPPNSHRIGRPARGRYWMALGGYLFSVAPTFHTIAILCAGAARLRPRARRRATRFRRLAGAGFRGYGGQGARRRGVARLPPGTPIRRRVDAALPPLTIERIPPPGRNTRRVRQRATDGHHHADAPVLAGLRVPDLTRHRRPVAGRALSGTGRGGC